MAVSKKAAAPVKSAKSKVGPARIAKAEPAKVAPKKAPAKAAPKQDVEQMSVPDFLKSLRDQIDAFLGSAPWDEAEASGTDEEADEETSAIDARRAELEDMTPAALRKLAKAAEFDPKDIKAAPVEQLVENLLEAEFGDAEDDEDEDEEDSEESEDEDAEDEEEEKDDGEDDYTREDLLAMSLSDLKNLAVQLGKADSKADLKGQDKDTVADLILEDDEESEDEEGEDDYYTREDYEAMKIDELKALADQCGISYKKTVKAAELIDALEAYEED